VILNRPVQSKILLCPISFLYNAFTLNKQFLFAVQLYLAGSFGPGHVTNLDKNQQFMCDAWCPWELETERLGGNDGNVIFTRRTSSKGHGKHTAVSPIRISRRSLENVLPSICIFYLFLYPFSGWRSLSVPAEHLSSSPPLVARPWIFRVCPVLLHFGTHILLSSKVDKGFARTGGRSIL